jgi:hypothetical protein
MLSVEEGVLQHSKRVFLASLFFSQPTPTRTSSDFDSALSTPHILHHILSSTDTLSLTLPSISSDPSSSTPLLSPSFSLGPLGTPPPLLVPQISTK